MLCPDKTDKNFKEETARHQKELKEGSGVTSWGLTGEAIKAGAVPLSKESKDKD